MSLSNFKVSISPEKAFTLVKNSENADLVHEEFHDLGEGKSIGTLVFEKYYMRTKNRAAFIVIIDNIQGITDIRVIATGSASYRLIDEFMGIHSSHDQWIPMNLVYHPSGVSACSGETGS